MEKINLDFRFIQGKETRLHQQTEWECLQDFRTSLKSVSDVQELGDGLYMLASLSVDCSVLEYGNLTTTMEGLLELVDRKGSYSWKVLENMNLSDRHFLFSEFFAFCFLFVLILFPLWLAEVL